MKSRDRPAEGVLPRQRLAELVSSGAIHTDDPDLVKHLQPASVDLTLGDVAYRLRCSFLPGNQPVRDKLLDYEMGQIDLSGDGAVLEQNRPYLIPLRERLRLPKGIRGRTNPRSSTGRLDVFTRVITDYGNHFDEVRDGYSGELFLEVVPMSFTVKAKAGITLNQLRLLTGQARLTDDELIELGTADPIAFPGQSSAVDDEAYVSDGLFLSVDLSGADRKFAGYRAKPSSGLLELDRVNAYQVGDFWERVYPDDGRLILGPDQFYLLVSRERVRIPPGYAAEMAAYDPTSGELRTHYAGFFDPGFGDVPDGEWMGTPAVLEVRAHTVPFALEHGQRLCKLTFERMTEKPDELYGSAIGSRYQRQYLTLSRQFLPDQAGKPKPRRMKGVEQNPLPLVSGGRVDSPPLPVTRRD
ncbi:MAG TPA: 2'-deoxycytidine 5'-triphosphate deaminase [Candidatus Limnocylindrales bacterium]